MIRVENPIRFKKPKIEIVWDWFTMIFEKNVKDAGSRLESGPESGPESIANRILKALVPKALSKSEIAKTIGHTSISGKLNISYEIQQIPPAILHHQ